MTTQIKNIISIQMSKSLAYAFILLGSIILLANIFLFRVTIRLGFLGFTFIIFTSLIGTILIINGARNLNRKKGVCWLAALEEAEDLAEAVAEMNGCAGREVDSRPAQVGETEPNTAENSTFKLPTYDEAVADDRN